MWFVEEKTGRHRQHRLVINVPLPVILGWGYKNLIRTQLKSDSDQLIGPLLRGSAGSQARVLSPRFHSKVGPSCLLCLKTLRTHGAVRRTSLDPTSRQ